MGHATLAVRHGKLAAEGYWSGYDATMANCIKSVSKSILSAAYGLAIEDGHLAGPEQRVASLLPEVFDDADRPQLAEITFGQLMNMSAGLEWDEQGASLGNMVASQDWPAWVAAQPFVSAPGARWNYSTGLTHVASTALARATGETTRAYVERRLFEPLGISATRWDLDPAGVHMGGAEVWMRDFAGHPTYFAWGYGGQFIFVVPDLDLVVVATSAWFRGAQAATNGQVFALLEDFILPAAEAPQPLSGILSANR